MTTATSTLIIANCLMAMIVTMIWLMPRGLAASITANVNGLSSLTASISDVAVAIRGLREEYAEIGYSDGKKLVIGGRVYLTDGDTSFPPGDIVLTPKR